MAKVPVELRIVNLEGKVWRDPSEYEKILLVVLILEIDGGLTMRADVVIYRFLL